jgi:tyrosine-protein kinase Etk/Wzc
MQHIFTAPPFVDILPPAVMRETGQGEGKNPSGERTLLESLLHYVGIALKYRWLIIVVTAVSALGAIGFSMMTILLPPEKSPLPNLYTANATVLVQKGMNDNLSASILASLGIQSQPTDTALGFEIGLLLVQVLKSRTIIDKVIEEFELMDRYGIESEVRSRARLRVLGSSSFSYNRSTATVTISFKDIDPAFAQAVTNRMVSLLNEWFAQNIGSSNLKQKLLLEEKLKEVKDDVSVLENRLKDLQRKYGVLSAQDLGTSQATALAALRSQLILKEIEIKNYSTIAAIEDPKLQQLKDERQTIVDLISQTQQGLTEALGTSGRTKSLPDIQIEFNNLTVELDVQQEIYNTLSQQYEVLKLTSEPGSAFQVMELAEAPDSKSGPSRSKIVVIAIIAGFVVSTASAFLLHALAQMRRNRKSAPT